MDPDGSTPLNPAKGPFSWTVQSMDYSGSLSPREDVGRTFSIGGIPEDTPAASLTPSPTPAGTRFPALQWEPLPGATYYRVRVGVAGTTGTRRPRPS